MSNKNRRYEEPKMPESLRKLLDDDFSQDEESKIAKQRPKKRPVDAQKKRPKSKRPATKPANRPPAGKKVPKAKADRNRNGARPVKNAVPKKQARPSRPVKPIPQEATRKIPVVKDEAGRRGSSDKARKQRLYEEERTKRIPVAKSGKPGKPVKRAGRPAPKQGQPVKKNVRKTEPPRKQVPKKKKRKKSAGIKHIFSLIIYAVLLVIGFIFTGGNKKKYISKDERKRLDQKFYRILSVVSIAVLASVMVISAVAPKKKTSAAENRALQQKPKFTIQTVLTGAYTRDYAKYLSDQFPARKSMIRRKAKFDMMLGRKEINGVYICKDGYLMEGFTESPEDITDAKIKAVNNFVSQNPKLSVSMMIVPNKVEIYKNLLPKNTPSDSQSAYLNKLKDKVDKKVNFVNLIEPFEKVKNSTQLYYKTDHHWTTFGAYKGYEEFAKSKDISISQEDRYTKSLATDKFLGSLYYKNGAQIGEPEDIVLYLKDRPYPLLVKYFDTKEKKTTLFDIDKLKTKDKYEVFTGGNHSQIKIRTNVKTKRKLLLIKDSYANAMLPFLINDFAEINVVDLRYYTGTMADILNNNDITDVLILYNVNTFNTDPSILNIYDPNYHSEDNESEDDGKSAKSDDTEKESDSKTKKVAKSDLKPENNVESVSKAGSDSNTSKSESNETEENN